MSSESYYIDLLLKTEFENPNPKDKCFWKVVCEKHLFKEEKNINEPWSILIKKIRLFRLTKLLY